MSLSERYLDVISNEFSACDTIARERLRMSNHYLLHYLKLKAVRLRTKLQEIGQAIKTGDAY